MIRQQPVPAHEPAPTTHGILIKSPLAYELMAEIGFLGQRRRLFTRLVELSGARPGDHVLDVGCGTGYFSSMAAKAVTPGGTVLGVDPSPPVIQHARTRRAALNCTYKPGIAEALDATDESFDVVISSFMVHHLPAEVRLTAIQQMLRVLRPAGRLLIAEYRPPNGRLTNKLVGALAHPAMKHSLRDELDALIREAGFDCLTTGDLKPSTHYITAIKPASTTGTHRPVQGANLV